MHFLIAPDSFKASLNASAVTDAIAVGLVDIVDDVTVVKRPMADGGEGTIDAILASQSGRVITTKVIGPLGGGQLLSASFGVMTIDQKKIAIVELAQSSGLGYIPQEKQNPLYTTTFGYGQLIASALDQDIDKLILALGGSGTNDCGCGMLQALGIQFKDGFGDDIVGEMTAALLSQVSSIDTTKLDHRLSKVEIEICCDVNNVLLGTQGASTVYGPQKGASTQIVMQLEQNMNHIINIIEKKTERAVRDISGSGAAGGVAAALLSFTHATVVPGGALVMQLCSLEDAIAKADVVITGEGQLDTTSKMGKIVSSIAVLAKKHKKPVIAIVGQNKATKQEIAEMGIAKVVSLVNDNVSIAQAQANPVQHIQAAISKIDFLQLI